MPSPTDRAVPRVAFINGGILGLRSYADWIRTAFADDRDLHAELMVLADDLTLQERVVRRVMCQRLWPDPPGLGNLDFARFRQELHAGVQARRRLMARGLQNFDVLHFHRQATAYASLDLMRRVPSIVTMDCTQTCAMQDLKSPVERWTIHPNVRRDGTIFARARAIIAASSWAQGDFHRLYPDCTTPVHVFRGPVVLEWFSPDWPQERDARAASGARPRVMFMGGDFVRKGGYDLLEAWQAGGFAARAELMLVTDWQIGALPDGVAQCRGVRAHTPRWAALWRDADVFAMPTRNEAFGLVYQEAAAAGLPAIGTRMNAIPELVQNGSTGYLVAPRDQRALIDALRSLIDSAALRKRMGVQARLNIEHDADPGDHRRHLLAIIRELWTGS